MHQDYRDIARDMGIYVTNPVVGSGLPLWKPAGAALRRQLERFADDLAERDGCQHVYSPVLAKRALYEQSGHWTKFHDDMFPAMEVGGEEFVLRPANCPHHAALYAADQHSYRDLPVRFHELGSMFRSERSGVLSGLTRVRQISLDDTHVLCRPDQVGAEAQVALRSILHAYDVMEIPVHHLRLSLRDASPSYLGDAESWALAEAHLREVVHASGVSVREEEGEAAFYGPKIDVQVRDAEGREETLATVQVDFQQPERFNLHYTGADGAEHRVVMIHRGVVGSMERVTAALLEHHQGRVPLWLAPVQLCVLPVGEAHAHVASALVDRARDVGLRVRLEAEGSLGARRRASRQRRDSVMAVLGDAEEASGEAQVTDVRGEFSGSVPVEHLIAAMAQAVSARAPRITWPS